MHEAVSPETKQQKPAIQSALHHSLEWGEQENLPRQFGRLILLRRLARGGMGEVYLAATRGIEGAERPCVVKTIRREHASDRSFRARFLDETRIQAQLQHPGVAQIVEAATLDDERPYAVVEFIEGRHLGEIQLRSNQLSLRLDWADVVAVGISFADALAHVHERTDAQGRPLDIAHRDLSPQNVMLGYSGDLKLIDFGTARGENRRCRTVSGIVYAKPGYVAPEVANQTPGSAPADLYALGVMLWELLAGRRFLQGDAVAHQAAVASGELRLPALAPLVPEKLDEILARLTHPDVTARTPSARRAVFELAELLKEAPSLADGDRSVRGRIALLMQKLYPAEPARTRADFARRVAQARALFGEEKVHSSRPGIPEPSPVAPETGQELDDLLAGTRYRLKRLISGGEMGEVWEAEHVDLSRKVALKLLPASVSQSHSARRRFRAEARAVARLVHPGLVQLHDFGVTLDGRLYYGMELLDGQSLAERLKQGVLPWQEAVQIIIQAAQALHVAHSAGIVHRDITPSNLFLTREGEVKLLDFGVAGSLSEGAAELEQEGPVVVGTPEYISPEQAAGTPADVRSDLYALGVVLYEALTGQIPHPLGPSGAPTLAALFTAKITLVPPAPSSCVGAEQVIPEQLDKIVLRILERDADKRYTDAEALVRALQNVSEQKSREQKKRQWLGLAAAAAVALVALPLVWSESQEPEASAWTTIDLDRLVAEQTESASSAQERAPLREEEVQGATGPAAQEDEPGGESALEESQAEPQDSLGEEVARLVAESRAGQRIAAHHQMKLLAARFAERAEVYQGLVQTARGVKAWGEALAAARQRVQLEPSPEARLELARLEKLTTQGDPVSTLQALLAEHPAYEPALQLLHEYSQRELAQR